jgi:hypothetical protein
MTAMQLALFHNAARHAAQINIHGIEAIPREERHGVLMILLAAKRAGDRWPEPEAYRKMPAIHQAIAELRIDEAAMVQERGARGKRRFETAKGAGK